MAGGQRAYNGKELFQGETKKEVIFFLFCFNLQVDYRRLRAKAANLQPLSERSRVETCKAGN